MPRVSAAIITHNRARFLADAITSVLAQTVSDLELIVVDSAGIPLPERTSAMRELFGAAHRPRATYASYAFDCRCMSSTILVPRSVFDAVGLYDCELPIEDYDFYLRLVLDFDVLFLDG